MEAGLLEPSMYTVKGVLILDNDGERILSKYYDDTYPTVKEQKEFEKNLFNKTSRANAEIVMFEGLTCVYRSNIDLYFYVIGSANENEMVDHYLKIELCMSCETKEYSAIKVVCYVNSVEIVKIRKELILVSVLNAFYDTISQILRKSVEKKMLFDNLDIIMLAMDELVDGGIILDADATSIIHKVAMKNDDVPLSERSVADVLQSAKDQLKWSLLK